MVTLGRDTAQQFAREEQSARRSPLILNREANQLDFSTDQERVWQEQKFSIMDKCPDAIICLIQRELRGARRNLGLLEVLYMVDKLRLLQGSDSALART